MKSLETLYNKILKAIEEKERQEITVNTVNESKNTEDEDLVEKPKAVIGGIKIWCKPEDKRKVLDIISGNSTIDGVLADENMFETANKAHIDFDLTQMPTGRYRLSGGDRFNLEKSIQELKKEGIPHIVDTETGRPVFADGEGACYFSIGKEEIDFKLELEEKNEGEDKLEEFAKRLDL